MPPISLAPVSGRYLSFAEREEIAILHAQHVEVREISRQLGRSPSTISRELRRNASTRSNELTYRASTAQWHAERRGSRPKVSKLAATDALREYVQDRLAGTITRPDGELVPGPDVRFIARRHGRRQDRRWATAWSPEQIANRIRVDFPHDETMRISHEAIPDIKNVAVSMGPRRLWIHHDRWRATTYTGRPTRGWLPRQCGGPRSHTEADRDGSAGLPDAMVSRSRTRPEISSSRWPATASA